MKRKTIFTISFDNVVATAMTKKALLVNIDNWKYWIPLSQISDGSEVRNDTNAARGRLVISEWIAVKKGLAPVYEADMCDGDFETECYDAFFDDF